jgi:hypothetical protein
MSKLWVAGMCATVLAGSASADAVKFTDRTKFKSAAGGDLDVIDFESTSAGSQTYLGNAYTVSGVTFKSNHMYGSDGDVSAGWFSLGSGDTLMAGYQGATGDSGLVALLGKGTRSVGLDIGVEGGGSYTMTFASGQTITGLLKAATYDGKKYVRDSDFVGFTSDSDIASIRFDLVGNGWKIVDNFTTGGAVSAVPLPAAAWGGIALLGGLGLTRRLQRRAEYVTL